MSGGRDSETPSMQSLPLVSALCPLTTFRRGLEGRWHALRALDVTGDGSTVGINR